ncbi:MAG: dethiobiotin synthase [Dokdonella sp.]|uniref:dethiobiotin synthase n=1 Tax=Dokdonella sp. TaxID=2291710 RepID=UPI002BEA3AF3|nr:dethiobiotin synthase [Dokdonella sp.]HOX72642.1 dethiobiotin synthase [Dokdonella sp.]HPN78507.1 dethiobiotin synthase [Dokdonella sp.]
MIRGLFISGTDTGIGKTLVSCALLRGLRASGVDAVGMKPVASGCTMTSAGLRNDDALDLIAASGRDIDYGLVNPYAFAEPIAPHLAAADAGTPIDLARICNAHAQLRAQSECVVVEGVGGWLAPLGGSLMQSDLVLALELPVVLVVGLRLGCINHALLTARAIKADGCRLIGWIANRIDPAMLRIEDNIDALRQRIQAPLLDIVEHAGNPRVASEIRLSADALRVLLADAGN